MKKTDLGEKIKRLRKERGLTQEKLAELIEIDNKHLSKIENGFHFPTYKTLEKLSKILDFDITENCTQKTSETKQNPDYLKSIKILNSAKNEKEIRHYLEVLKVAQKGLNLK